MTGGHGWTFLSNHGHVLAAIAFDPDARVRDLAERVGITERAAQQIVGELVAEGIVLRHKSGRRNRYAIAADAHLRHPLEAGVSVGDFTALLTGASSERPAHRSCSNA